MQDVIELEQLQGARWFAGKARRVTTIRDAGGFSVDNAGRLRLADVDYADGGSERYLVPDEGLRWGDVVRALRAVPADGPAGRLELRPAPALDVLLPERAGAPERVPSVDQTNTLVTVGDRLLVKAYRKLEPGVHPEVELGAALVGTGAPVPAHAGSLHVVAPDGSDTTIALLQEHVAGARSGWEPPIEDLRTVLAGAGEHDEVVAFWRAAGAAAGVLQAALAERLGLRDDAGAPARWHASASAALAEAARLDPRAAAARDALAARLAGLAEDGAPPPVGRVHGDLHVAQLLHAGDAVLVVDLEGDPTVPLAQRGEPDTPLRDLAALLRSVDHVGAAAARRAGGADPGPLVEAARAAVLDGYRSRATIAVAPALLAALEAAAACRELVYAHRVVPEWAYAAQAGLARLLGRTS